MSRPFWIACLTVLILFVSQGGAWPAETVLRFVTWKPSKPEAWNEVLRRFENRYPEIRVEQEVGPHSSSAYHDLLTQKLKNQDDSVDVFLMDVIWPPEFAAAGWAVPLDDYFPKAEQEEFLTGPIMAATFNGHIYGVPAWLASGMLYYRKDLLAKYGFQPPQTWQELVHQATTIVEGEGNTNPNLKGFTGQFKQYEGLVCNIMEFVLSNDGYLVDTESATSGLREKAAIEAVRFVRDEVIGKVAPRGVLTYQEPESLAVFAQGRAVFHRNWPYAWSIVNDPEQSNVVGQVGIARLPSFPGGESRATLGGWMYGISQFSKNREIAWKFVEFMTSEEAQKFFAIEISRAPTRASLYSDPEVLRVNAQFASQFEAFQTSYPRPRTPVYPIVSNILQRYFSTAISDSESDIEALASDAAAEIEQALTIWP